MSNYSPGLVGTGVILGTDQPPEDSTNWRGQFRNLSEMEQGNIVMIIDGVLQEGTCFIGAKPGNGKTLVALALAKAICLGEPLFGIKLGSSAFDLFHFGCVDRGEDSMRFRAKHEICSGRLLGPLLHALVSGS